MKRLITVVALVAVCVPAAAAAKRPPRTNVLAAKNAAFACRALRTTMGSKAFLSAYGTNKKAHGVGATRNAFGKCVAQKARLFKRASLFEAATGTLTVAAPVGTTEAVTLAASLDGVRPMATGTVAGTFSVDLGSAVTKAGVTCAPVTGTLTLTQASPAGTLQKTLTSATFCKGPAGAALVGKYTLTGTGAFAGKTGTGTEVILAPTGASAHSVEAGSIS